MSAMVAQKLSISMESSLVEVVRRAAEDEGLSVSTWLSEAARSRARQRLLLETLAEDTAARGKISPDQVQELVEKTRKESQVSRRRKR
ncbi:MAG: hypothetical protein HY791_12190 [Deltaproteobacteria bacterium]|nr:hypothetical protein [Deltaproteobacteria bacterium]